jgi:hypothetical protein
MGDLDQEAAKTRNSATEAAGPRTIACEFLSREVMDLRGLRPSETKYARQLYQDDRRDRRDDRHQAHRSGPQPGQQPAHVHKPTDSVPAIARLSVSRGASPEQALPY